LIKICISEIKKSIKKTKLRIIVPDILYLFFIVVIATVFAKFSGISNISYEALQAHVRNNLVSLSLQLLLMVIILFFIGARLKAFKLSIILEAVKSKSTPLLKLYKESKKFYLRVIAIKLLLFLAILATLIVGVIVYILVSYINEILAAVISIILILIVTVALFYREAALILENTTASKAISTSYEVFKKNKGYVILIAIIIGIVNFLILYTNQFLSGKGGLTTSLVALLYLFIVLLISAWSSVFVFTTYESVAKKKEVSVKKVKKTTKKIPIKKTTKKAIKKTKKTSKKSKR